MTSRGNFPELCPVGRIVTIDVTDVFPPWLVLVNLALPQKQESAVSFAGLNPWAVVLAAVVSFIFGGVWYGVLGKAWMAAANLQAGDIRARAVPFIVAFVALLVMAWVLAGVIGHLGEGRVTLSNGVIAGAFAWAGFVLTTLVVNHAFQGVKPALTLIDGGHWLGVLLLQGAVIGLLGVP